MYSSYLNFIRTPKTHGKWGQLEEVRVTAAKVNSPFFNLSPSLLIEHTNSMNKSHCFVSKHVLLSCEPGSHAVVLAVCSLFAVKMMPQASYMGWLRIVGSIKL